MLLLVKRDLNTLFYNVTFNILLLNTFINVKLQVLAQISVKRLAVSSYEPLLSPLLPSHAGQRSGSGPSW